MSNTVDTYQTRYDYEQCRLDELENENRELKKQLAISTKALKDIIEELLDGNISRLWDEDE